MIESHAILQHRVTVPDGDGARRGGVAVDRHAPWGADLVLPDRFIHFAEKRVLLGRVALG